MQGLDKLGKRLSIKTSNLKHKLIKSPIHAFSIRKAASNKTLNRTRNMVTLALVRHRTGALTSPFFSSWKLASHESVHSNFLSFFNSSVIGFAILEKFSMNLR
jgi:hypothetical protein